jgi:hypothetical protein
MKRIYIISWISIILGLIFKFLHIFGAGYLITIGGLLLLIHCIVHLSKNAKSNLPLSLLYTSFAFITIYLIARFQYWAFARPLFPIVCLLIFGSAIIHILKRTNFHFTQGLLILYFIFFLIFSYVPSYKIYYSVNLNSLLNKESRLKDYHGWDKYSWFLYLRNKQPEALEANKNAENAIEKCLKGSNDVYLMKEMDRIKRHGEQIKDNSWVDYE